MTSESGLAQMLRAERRPNFRPPSGRGVSPFGATPMRIAAERHELSEPAELPARNLTNSLSREYSSAGVGGVLVSTWKMRQGWHAEDGSLASLIIGPKNNC